MLPSALFLLCMDRGPTHVRILMDRDRAIAWKSSQMHPYTRNASETKETILSVIAPVCFSFL